MKRLVFKYKVVLCHSNGTPNEIIYFKRRDDIINLLNEELKQVGFLYNRIAIYGIMSGGENIEEI